MIDSDLDSILAILKKRVDKENIQESKQTNIEKQNMTGKILPKLKEKIIPMQETFSKATTKLKDIMKFNDKTKKMRYLTFRPAIDHKIEQPEDKGYYYSILSNETFLIKQTLEDNGFVDILNKQEEPTIIWTGSVLSKQQYQSLSPYQKINHFPKTGEITRKDLLYKNLCILSSLSNSKKDFNFIPKSFILPQEIRLLELEMEKEEDIWIIKPVSSSQGRGIFLAKKFSDVSSHLSINKISMIASKYISNPLLIDGYKFDLRIYVLLLSVSPLKIYIYNQGLTRFATEKYDLTNFSNSKYMHLTNYAVNKENGKFVNNIDPENDGYGSKWSLKALSQRLESHGIKFDLIWDKIKDLVVKAILAGSGSINKEMNKTFADGYHDNCFELYGFDVLLDDTCQPWLLEINLTPSLHVDSPLDMKIKSQLISDMLNLIRITPKYLYYKEAFFIKDFVIKENDLNTLQELKSFNLYKSLKINSELKYLLWKESEEIGREGGWEKIFPISNSIKYLKYFTTKEEVYVNTIFCLRELNEVNPKEIKKYKLTHLQYLNKFN